MSLTEAWDQQQERYNAAREEAVRGAAHDEWWERARADVQLDALHAARDRVFDVPAGANPRPPLRGFLDLARRAGFSEVDTIWQRFDDRIVMAVKSGAPSP